MAKIQDILEDWFLTDEEVSFIKSGKKKVLIVPSSYPAFSKIMHFNGISFAVEEKLKPMTANEFLYGAKMHSYRWDFGVKDYTIPASCEHPELYCYAYVSYDKERGYQFDTRLEALKDHFVRLGYDLEKDKIQFVVGKKIY